MLRADPSLFPLCCTDLTPLFNYNTKQLMLQVVAEFQTEKYVCFNESVVTRLLICAVLFPSLKMRSSYGTEL